MRLAIKKIFKRVSLAYPQASDWPNQADRVEAWAREAERYKVSGTDLMAAYTARPPSLYPPSIGELALLVASPISDEEIERSLKRATRVACTDEYHLLSPQELWAFRSIGRWALKTEGHPILFKRWGALLREAQKQPNLPSPPPLQETVRIEAKRSEAARQSARKAISEALERLKKGSPENEMEGAQCQLNKVRDLVE